MALLLALPGAALAYTVAAALPASRAAVRMSLADDGILGVGVIGAGRIGIVHLEALSQVGGISPAGRAPRKRFVLAHCSRRARSIHAVTVRERPRHHHLEPDRLKGGGGCRQI